MKSLLLAFVASALGRPLGNRQCQNEQDSYNNQTGCCTTNGVNSCPQGCMVKSVQTTIGRPPRCVCEGCCGASIVINTACTGGSTQCDAYLSSQGDTSASRYNFGGCAFCAGANTGMCFPSDTAVDRCAAGYRNAGKIMTHNTSQLMCNAGVPFAGGSSDASCFDSATTQSCRQTSGGALMADEAYSHCFGHVSGETKASLTLMTELSAGDIVLTRTMEGLSLERIVINQHKTGKDFSPMLEIFHARGSLKLTPDHVLLVDGQLTPAHSATPGSFLTLGNGEPTLVTRLVALSRARVINPITTAGTILASANGEPVVATTHPEWIAAFMLAHPAPMPFPLFHLLAYAFPEKTQAYYDAVIEPLFKNKLSPQMHVLSVAPTVVVSLAFLAGDILSAVVFLSFTSSTNVILGLLAGACGLAASRVRKA